MVGCCFLMESRRLSQTYNTFRYVLETSVNQVLYIKSIDKTAHSHTHRIITPSSYWAPVQFKDAITLNGQKPRFLRWRKRRERMNKVGGGGGAALQHGGARSKRKRGLWEINEMRRILMVSSDNR